MLFCLVPSAASGAVGGAGAGASDSDAVARAAALRMFASLPKPSDAGKPGATATTIMAYEDAHTSTSKWATARIMADSPREHLSPMHTALIEPVFGEFLDLFHDTDNKRLDHSAYATAEDLLLCAAGSINPDPTKGTLEWQEKHWNIAYNDLLRRFVDMTLAGVTAAPQGRGEPFGLTDGSVVLCGFPVLNMELKMPGNDCTAELQNDQYFLRMVADKEGRVWKEFKKHGVRPAGFLVDILYQHIMVVRGVVYAPPALLSSTLATVNMVAPLHSKEHLALARALQGLRDGVARLKSRFSGWSFAGLELLPVAEHVGQLLPQHFKVAAFPASAAAEGTEAGGVSRSITLTVGRPILKEHMAFEAEVVAAPADIIELPSGSRFVLKIGRDRYGVDAHAAAASGACAPALLGYQRLPGGWCAVLMMRMEIEHGWSQYEPCNASQRAAVEHAYLHHVQSHGFVHGDLRPCNILVAPIPALAASHAAMGGAGGDGASRSAASAWKGASSAVSGSSASGSLGWRVCIIDWDWAGPAGSVRYPFSMNIDVKRAAGALPGAVITAAHDLVQLTLPEETSPMAGSGM